MFCEFYGTKKMDLHFWQTDSNPFRRGRAAEWLLTSICIWSGHTPPSMIYTPFHWHNCLDISLISMRFSSKNIFLWYFGVNIKWYLQFHFVCAKLLISMFSFFSSVNLFWTTRLSCGFRFTKKSASFCRNLPISCQGWAKKMFSPIFMVVSNQRKTMF